jgi:Tfp pilus assembly PilM family ATPase
MLGELGTQTGTHQTRRVALAMPDGIAKVSLVRFDKVPERREDLAELVRWQVKKAVPFPIEQAQVAWTQAGMDAAGATEFLVVIARRDIVEEYESACTDAGAHAGLVDLASCHLINLVLAGDPSLATPAREADKQDWLLVHVAFDSTTTAVMRGPDVILFRNRPAEGDESLADHVHQTTMYYEDRLRGERLSCVMVSAQDVEASTIAELNELCRGLEARGGVRVMAVDVRTAATLADRIAPSQEWLQAVAAPVGALVRAFPG